MDWIAGKKNGFVKEIKPDKNLAEAMLKSSEKKSISEEMLPLTKNTASSKVTLCYDSLRELLEALAVLKGFKIYNHECYTSFPSEIMEEKGISERFDKYRKIRNDINYYGKDIDPEETKSIIEGMKLLIQEIRKKYF